MAFRSDVSVNWAVSPRVITVSAPSTEILVQDLVDTLRTLESEIGALDDFSLLDATGKDALSATEKVGITLKLANARVAFEARPPPTYVQCLIRGGNIIAKDENEDDMSPVEPTAYTQVVISQSTSPTLVYASGGSPEEIADAVWNEPKADHTDPTGFGGEVQTHATTSELATAQGVITGAVATSESNIRGVDGDTLKTLSDQTDNLLDILGEVLEFFDNKLTINTATSEYWLWNSAGTVVIKKWPLTNKDGGPVVLTGTGPVNRGKRTL